MSKFENVSIYDVDFELATDNGEIEHFTFKPLPFRLYPKAFGIFSKFSDMKTEDANDMLKVLDEKTLTELSAILKEMVARSYPDLSEDKVEIFVMSNLFQLIEPLSKLIFRQTQANKRKATQFQNELSKDN